MGQEHKDTLSVVDTSFLNLESDTTHMHVGGISIFEGPPLDCDELFKHVEARLHLVPRYRQRLVFPPFGVAHPSWEDDPDFDIRNHVVEETLPPPGDDRVLSQYGGRVFAPLLDRERPLWQLILLHGGADGNTAVVWKVHHAMVDGVSVVDLVMTLHDLTAKADPPPPPPLPWQPRPLPDPLTLLQEAVRDQLAAAAQRWRDDAARLVQPPDAEQLATQLTGAAQSALPPLLPAAPMPFNGRLSERRQLVWAELDFSEVRRVKAGLGGTVNDLILAVISGALGRYLRQLGHGTEGVELRAQCPVSMRRPQERGALGNRVTSLIVPLYVGIVDPVERLAAERAAMEELKRQDQAARLYALGELADRIPPGWQAFLGGWQPEVPQTLVHTVTSNVPGPQIPLYLKGRRLLAMRLFGPLGGSVGLFNAIFSYNKTLAIGVTVDPTLVPDPWFYVECLRASFEELRDVATRRPDESAA